MDRDGASSAPVALADWLLPLLDGELPSRLLPRHGAAVRLALLLRAARRLPSGKPWGRGM